VTIRETYYLQSPYPVFLKVAKAAEGEKAATEGYICIAVAYRYKSPSGE
jgi:hypothetical protein